MLLDRNELNLGDDLFFVYITTKGRPDPDAINFNVNVRTMQPIAYLRPMYDTAIKLMQSLDSQCQDSSKLIDFILKINALNIALDTCNYQIAIKYWNKYFKMDKLKMITSKCK